ncbi:MULTISPECIES: GNAT family N-acetyltransferase [unclassified Halomonas]|uniref:GNAT family N-acetyltransferase n=1 Tax=unclassified Halomonas TaxID=2609666 RepID=UPI0006D956FC|nr:MULTISPECIES: GNAT family N-acetyltransferase [unclassified Halomonas]KPQ22549.1 MAG: putative acetyltransferase [Halomonas sp. HL-93]SBR45859.1 Ribosomal protein S18 acetylase RimI [Halomonas sp. HL-93]SNY98481.1 Ribosomal protein S18 acetylase RimI [Halomonas sp. hl-4]
MKRVRTATVGDLEALTELLDGYRRFYAQPSDRQAARDFLRQRFGQADSRILVSEDAEGALTGFVQLYPGVSTVGLNARWTLNDLFVLPECREKGTGRALMEAATKLAREHGVARLILMTQVENARAQHLYESLGWQRNTAFYGYLLDLK